MNDARKFIVAILERYGLDAALHGQAALDALNALRDREKDQLKLVKMESDFDALAEWLEVAGELG